LQHSVCWKSNKSFSAAPTVSSNALMLYLSPYINVASGAHSERMTFC